MSQELKLSQEQEGINLDDLQRDIEQQYQELCQKAQSGGSPTLDELADVVSNMCKMMEVVNDLAMAVIRLRGDDAQ